MTLKQFNRDTAYFQVMRDRSMMINAEDLDFEFNDLADYLNKKIVPLINLLSDKEIPGINNLNLEINNNINLTNACLLNVGDGSTRWTNIILNNVPDFSMNFSKFVINQYNELGTNFGSVIATDNSRIFTPTIPERAGDVLFSVRNNLPRWRKVKTGDIENGSITSSNIGLRTIGLEHLSVNNSAPLTIGNFQILNRHIAIGSILGENLKDGSIITAAIKADLLQLRVNSLRQNNYMFLDSSLENRHFQDKVIKNETMQPGFGIVYDNIYTLQPRLNPLVDDNINYTFTSQNIKDNSVQFRYSFGGGAATIQTCISPGVHFANNTITYEHIRDHSIDLPNKLSPNNLIRKEKLSRAIRTKLGL